MTRVVSLNEIDLELPVHAQTLKLKLSINETKRKQTSEAMICGGNRLSGSTVSLLTHLIFPEKNVISYCLLSTKNKYNKMQFVFLLLISVQGPLH